MRDEIRSPIEVQKSTIVNRLLIGISIVLIPILLMVIHHGREYGFSVYSFIQILVFVAIWLMTFGGFLKNTYFRATIIISILLIATILEVHRFGLASVSLYMLTFIPVFATLMLGIRQGLMVLALILASLTFISTDWVVLQRDFPTSLDILFHDPFEWLAHILNVALASAVGIFATGSLNQFNERSNRHLERGNLQLQQSVDRLEQLSEVAKVGHAYLDPETGRYIECDKAFAEMHGRSRDQFPQMHIHHDVIGKIVIDEHRDRALQKWQEFLQGKDIDCDCGFRMPDNRIRHLRIIMNNRPYFDRGKARIRIIAQDVTRYKELQRQLSRSQRVETIGELAGGAAHNFNNLLAVITGNLELIRNDVINGSPSRESTIYRLDSCIDAAMRGSHLTNSMLSFARKAPLKPDVFQLNRAILELNEWSGSTLPANIRITLDLDDLLPEIEADRHSTESAILNLVLNACHAMPDGGTLLIRTSLCSINDVSSPSPLASLKPGPYARVRITDSGIGIPEQDLNQIFEPFFTTRPSGLGSGLGLSMVQGFMEQTGGTVQVNSSPGQGASFSLYFPITDTSREVTIEKPVEACEQPARQQRLLLVEDTSELLEVMTIALEQSGYLVTSATTADKALQCYQACVEGFDLLITDLSMPGKLQGVSLAEILRKSNPQLPVIFISGFTDSGFLPSRENGSNDFRLDKPFRIDTLLSTTSKALCPQIECQ